MDANVKVGSEVFEDDPNDISGNGKHLLDFVKKQNLRILNCSPKCIGTVTRTIAKDEIEIAVLDYIIGCDVIANMVNMIVDEERKVCNYQRGKRK